MEVGSGGREWRQGVEAKGVEVGSGGREWR